MRRSNVLGLCLAVLLTTLSLSLPASAGKTLSSFTWSADCTEIASGVSVPVENLEDHVPDGYRILGEETGTAVLNVGIGHCTDMLVDGQQVKDSFTGFVAVFIEDPQGGVGRYYLWSNGTSKPVHRRLKSLGLPSISPKGMSLEINQGLPQTTAAGEVPRVGKDQGGYSLSVSSAPNVPAPASMETSYWHEGERGLVQAAFSVSFSDLPPGQATLMAEPGTVMSELIGGTEADGGALLARFHFDATFSLAPAA